MLDADMPSDSAPPEAPAPARPFAPAFQPPRGWLVPIGGALFEPEIFTRFLALCGGPGARVAVIPVASRLPRTGAEYADALRRHGAADAAVVDFRSRVDSEHPDLLAELARCDGVFFTGGDQVRLAEVLGGTPVARLLRRRNADGMPVAGTSAGASYLSERMIARGWSGARPRPGMVTLTTGLGLAPWLVIDQHFRERRRQGRLLSAVALTPGAAGVGVDENTAAFIAPDGTVEVVGAGAVTVVRPGARTRTVGALVHTGAGGTRADAPTALRLPRAERRRAPRPAPALVLDPDTLDVDVVPAGRRYELDGAAAHPPVAV
jgi:cyanophycinase